MVPFVCFNCGGPGFRMAAAGVPVRTRGSASLQCDFEDVTPVKSRAPSGPASRIPWMIRAVPPTIHQSLFIISIPSFIPALEIPRCLRHDHLGFLFTGALDPIDESLGFFPLEDLNLFAMPCYKNLAIFGNPTRKHITIS